VRFLLQAERLSALLLRSDGGLQLRVEALGVEGGDKSEAVA
jgi:hypothetical protein